MRENNILEIKSIFVGVGAVLGLLIGDVNNIFIALVIFVIIDYVTGVTAAIINKKLNSEIGYKGITRKILIMMVVAIANVLDVYVIGTGNVLRSATILFYIANEGISIIENISKCGLPIPEKLKIILEQLKEEDNKWN